MAVPAFDVRVEEVIREELLDHVTFVAEANHEIRQPVVAVEFHDMPQDRVPPDFNHRLRLGRAFLGDSGAETAG